jgi:uncharacterized membrane protein YedE/YeeE
MSDGAYLPFWLAAIALTAVPMLHWLLLRRPLAVSGRCTAIVDRVRHGAAPDASEPAMTDAQMIAAMRAMTAETFGADSVQDEPADKPASALADELLLAPVTPVRVGTHLLFVVGLVVGGSLSMLLGAGLVPTVALRGALFTQLISASPIVGGVVLFVGGLLVGAGTRMAGGCTSGHGLCGVSQLQPGSLVATLCFFGAGVITSFALGALG